MASLSPGWAGCCLAIVRCHVVLLAPTESVCWTRSSSGARLPPSPEEPESFPLSLGRGDRVTTTRDEDNRISAWDIVTPDPDWVREHIVTATVPIIGPVTGKRLFFPQLVAALGEVVDRGLAHTIFKGHYGGAYFPRYIAGTHVLSNHAFGLAIDLNVAENQRGTVGQMNRTVVQIFNKWGFTWGGTWAYTDPMHFEINRLMAPSRGGSA